MTTFSTSLKLELPGDGQQTGTWGQTTNKNLGTLLEQAICGSQSIVMTDANYTLTNLNGTTDEARNAILVVSGTNTAIRDVIAPVVKKIYTVSNNTTGGYAIRIIGASGTGVTIPNGMSAQVYCNGTNFVTLQNGAPGNFVVNGNLGVVGTTILDGSLSGTTAAFSGAITSLSPAFSGTPTAPTAAGGTNTTQIATTAFVTGAVTAATGSLGTMSTQNANAVAITGGTVTGITDLAVADGGTGRSALTANNLLLGNGTSAVNFVAPGTSGNVLTSNGTTWTSASSSAQVFGSTWTNLTGSKTSFNTYTNSTGKFIQVFCNSGCNGGGNGQIYINGNLVARWAAQFNGCGGYSCNMAAIVPPGATYYITSDGAVNSWWELL